MHHVKWSFFMFHTFDICQSIAEKLRNVNQIGMFSPLKNWQETSVASGWPSLSLFYSVLDAHFPNEKFDQLAHEYLVLSLSKTHPSNSLSILNGTSGLCFTVYMCSQNRSRYQTLLTQLDQRLIEELDGFLQKRDRSMNDYNLLNGISGALAYLLLRQDDPLLLFYAKQCLSSIVNFIQSKKTVSGHFVPGWHEESGANAHGRFALNSLNGVSGLLSTLALASIDGLFVDGLQEAIRSLAEWLKSKQKDSPDGPSWPAAVTFEEEIGEKEEETVHFPNIWFFGSSAIARSLYLAYKAVDDHDLKAYAEDTFLQTLTLPYKDFSPSFGFGKAGLLAMVYRMYQDTKNGCFLQKINELEYELKNAFSPNSLFGFQTRDLFTGQLMDDPGILDGAIGTALTLLLVAEKQDLNWDRLFLLR